MYQLVTDLVLISCAGFACTTRTHLAASCTGSQTGLTARMPCAGKIYCRPQVWNQGLGIPVVQARVVVRDG